MRTPHVCQQRLPHGQAHLRPSGREKALENIHLSFLPGAKIEVIGPNGAGKSTLLRIMAGLETGYTGNARAAKGIRIGCLVQEPALDNRRTVRENVVDGVAEEISLLGAFNSAAARLAEEDPDEILAELAGLLSTLPPSGGEDRMEGDRRTDDPSAVPRWGR